MSKTRAVLATVCGLSMASLICYVVTFGLSKYREQKLVAECLATPSEEAKASFDQLMEKGTASPSSVSRLLEHPDWRVRRHVLRALNRAQARAAIPAIGARLKDRCWPVRVQAALRLGLTHDTRCTKYLSSALADPSPQVRAASCLALGLLGCEEACVPLVALLEQEQSDCVLAEAADALTRIPSGAGVRWALRALNEEGLPENVVLAAAHLLSEANLEAKCVDVLIKGVSHGSPSVREPVLKALGRTRSNKAVPVLGDAMAHESFDLKETACKALGAIASRGAVDALIAALEDRCPVTRRQAATQLGVAGDGRAILALVRATSDPCQDVREQALVAVWWIAEGGFDGHALNGLQTVEWWQERTRRGDGAGR